MFFSGFVSCLFSMHILETNTKLALNPKLQFFFEAPAGATFREAQMCVLRDGLRKLDLEKSLPQPLLEAMGRLIH